MLESQRERDWETISELMALIANVNNSKRGKVYTGIQFNPTVDQKYNAKKVLPYSKESMEMAKAFFSSFKR